MSFLPPVLDPERLGAKCSRCFLFALRQGGPVGPELSRRAKAALVGEAPGKDEVEVGRPFVGSSGTELTTSLASIGVARDDVTIVNAIACRPPGNDLETLLHRCQQTNKKIVQAGGEPWLNPIEACRPMMQHFIEPYDHVITVGKTAMRSVTQMQSSIMDMRGAPVTGVLAPPGQDGLRAWLQRETLLVTPTDPAVAAGGRFIQLLPTLHPAFVQRQRRWTKVFRADLARAFRWFRGELGWRDPKMNLRPTLSELRDFLYSGAPFYAYDVETDAKESLLARLRCIGFATPGEAVVVPLLSVDGYSKFYTEDEEGAILDLLRAWFTDRRIVKVGWNAGYYDRIVIETRLGVTPVPLVDGMIVHRNVDSELPHNLAFVGALFTDVARAWKASHAAVNAQTDEELHIYNCLHRGTRVVLEDGSAESIENLVRAKYDGSVLAYEGGRIVSRRVTGWHQQRRAGQKWLAVKHALCNQNERGVVATPDHAFIERHKGRVEAQHLQPGDEIALPEVMWSKEQSQAILGTLLGDSTLLAAPSQRGGKITSYALRCGHAAAGGLTPYKIAALAPHAKAGKGRPAGTCYFKGRPYPQDAVQEVLTPNLRSLALLAPQVYTDGKRRLRVEALEWMGPVGWAWWFMDDGSRQKGQRLAQNTGARGDAIHNPETVALATNDFPREDIDAALVWFRARFGPTWAGKDKVLRLGRVATDAFCAAIAPHLPPQARYKLPQDRTWPAFNQPPAGADGMPVWVKVESVEPFVPSRRTAVERWNAEQRYCLTVEGAHNFFTTAGLVKNCGDVVVNARIMEPLVQACTMQQQMAVAEVDHKSQAICAGLHRSGIFVDQEVRRKLDEKFRKEAQEHLHYMRITLGDPDFNPNSVLKVRELLFDRWGLTPLETTKLGDPSTNDDTLRKLLLLRGLPQERGDFLRSLRKFRRAVKFRGTFIQPLRPYDEPLFEDDPYAVDINTVEGAALFDELVTDVIEDVQGDLSPKALRRALKKAAGKVLADGRVHSNWNAHVATTGRLSSSDPNVQNIVRALRAMFRAEEGRGLVASDYDQLELRISAAYAGAARYLEAFAKGLDPHAITAEAIYGSMWRNGSEKDRKRIRDFAKRFVYAVIYGATVETIHDSIASAENDKGELVFPWVTLRETDTLVRRWMKENSEYARWWEDTIATYRKDLFLSEPVLGRRRFFLDGEDRNEIINYRVQAAGASCVTKASIALTDGPLRFDYMGPGTGLIQNGHDALMAECPCKHLNGKPYKGKDAVHGGHPPLGPGEKCPLVQAGYDIQEAMTQRFAGYDVMLTATPKIGYFWSEV